MAKSGVMISVGPSEVSIRINGLPHLMLRRQTLHGVQSYYKTIGVREPLYFIEFAMAEGVNIVADYPDRGLWECILKALRDARIFDHMLGTDKLPGSA